MWKHKRLFLVVGGILAVIVSGQLLYPREIALPFARAAGESTHYLSHDQLTVQFQQQFESTIITVSNGDRTATRRLSTIGASLNADRMADEATNYPLWQRFIPLSIVVRRPNVASFDVELAGTKLETAAQAVATELSYPPTDASLTITDGKLAVVDAKSGKQVTAQNVRAALVAAQYKMGTTNVAVSSTEVKPVRVDSDIAAAKAQAQAALSRDIRVRVEGKGEYAPDVALRASWLTIKLDVAPATLSVNHELLTQFVNDINSKVATAPKNSVVSIIDGNETGRTDGVDGSALNVATVVDELAAALLDAAKPATIATSLVPVSPGTTTARTYTHSQEGLRAYVAYTTRTSNVHIVVKQLDGEGWSASGRADDSIPSASTYKLYVAKMIFKKMDEGAIHWDDPMLDTTVSGCFDRMTIASTNPCAEEWLNQFGRNAMNDYVHSLGFSGGTTFTAPDAVHTTANDLAKYMTGLEDGSLVGGAYRDRLLHSLGTHPYRYGIPTGVQGTVYDKVGFLWDYVHDAAIVYGPKGKYILVVMTQGYSYGYIANVARQIESIMYQ